MKSATDRSPRLPLRILPFLALLFLLIPGPAASQASTEVNEKTSQATVNDELLLPPDTPAVSLIAQGEPLAGVLERIAKQTGWRFAYSTALLESAPLIRATYANTDGVTVLTEILSSAGLTYALLSGGQIQIMKAPLKAASGGVTVRGQVLETGSEEPLPGANVVIKGTSTGTTTDGEGRFQLEVPSDDATLVFSFIGFSSKEVAIEGRDDLVVYLERGVDRLDELVVDGRRHRRSLVLNEQYQSERITNIVSAEQIQDYADTNVAEALQRIPGVVMSGSNDEGIVASMRGLPSDFTAVTINGQRVPSMTTSGRGTAIGIINAEAVESIEISKTVTPDMDAESTGGSINLRTRRLQIDERIFDVGVGAGLQYAERQLPNYSANAIFGDTFSGVNLIVDGNFRRTTPYYNGLRTYGWRQAEAGGEAFRAPERVRQNFYEAERARYGLNATIDFGIADHSSFFVRTSLNYTEDDQTNAQYRFDSLDFSGPSTVQSARGRHFGRFYDYTYQLSTAMLGAEHKLGFGTLNYDVSWARAGFEAPYVRATFGQEDLSFAFDVVDNEFPTLTSTNGTREFDPSRYQMIDLRTRTDQSYDRDYAGALNLEVPFQLLAEEHSVKVGGRYTSKFKYRDRDYSYWTGWPDGTDMTSFTQGANVSSFLEGQYGFGPRLNRNLMDQFIAQNQDQLQLRVNASRAASDVSSYESGEDIAAAYGMATLNAGPLMVVGGGRYEGTYISYVGNEVQFDFNGDYVSTTPVEATERYGGFYPMVQARLRLTNTANLRLAATRTLARPGHFDMVPYQEVNPDNGVINQGNPDLEPASIRNLDAIFEQYLPGQAGVFSVGLFQKDVSDFITQRLFIQEQGPFAGFPVIEPVNGLDATVWGIETNWIQDLSFLPGVLQGLGVSANYTYTQSDADFGPDVREFQYGDRTVNLPGQSDHVLNAALNYTKGGFLGNIAANYRGEYLSSIGSDADGSTDEFVQGRTRLDLTLRQQLPTTLSPLGRSAISLEAANLTGSNQRRFIGAPENVSRIRSYYRTFRVTFTMGL